MAKWHDNQANVKDIFDGLRNFGLCGLVFYAGAYSLVQMPDGGLTAKLYLITGALFIVLAIYLVYVNTRSLQRQIDKWEHGRVAAFLLPIAISAFSIFLLTHSALSIPLANGKTLGSTKVGISVTVDPAVESGAAK